MAIRLTAVGGPLDGQIFEFAKVTPRIAIGRLENSDIRFPPEFRSVSRAHCTIVLEGNRYRLRHDEPVYIDGHEALRDEELPRNCVVRLGGADGPGFKVEWNVLSEGPTTEAPYKQRRLTPARAAIRTAAHTRMLAAVAIGLVVLMAAGIGAYLLTRPESITATLAAARPSVYHVEFRRKDGFKISEATAWVVAPDTLATNAHVVGDIENALKNGAKAYVRSSVPPYEVFEIASALKHPHYDRFRKSVDYYVPVAQGGRLIGAILAYDVGLLRVAPGTKLAPPLKLASPETLEALAAGQEIGYLGFPNERMSAGGVNVAQPTPQMLVARISAMTDFFLAEGAPKDRLLIQHSLPGTGGASGSPVFNSRGEVIGLFNAVNFIFLPVNGQTVRIPTTLVNFAQRVDLIQELLEAKGDSLTTSRDAEWRSRLEKLPSAPEYLIQDFQRSTKSVGEKPALDTTLTLAKIPGFTFPAAIIDYEIPSAGVAFFQALGPDTDWVYLHLLDATDHQKQLAVKTGQIHYPWLKLDATEPKKIAVRVVGKDAGKQIRLRVYFVPKKAS